MKSFLLNPSDNAGVSSKTLLTSDGFILTDVNGKRLTVKGSE